MKRISFRIYYCSIIVISTMGITFGQQDTSRLVVKQAFNKTKFKVTEPDASPTPQKAAPATTTPSAPAKAPSQGLPASVQPIHENDSDTKPKN